MARMAIDDSVARDPRITALAKAVGWSRREVVGCLVTDVWPICYDQETALVSPHLVNTAAGHDGFADLMVLCELARVSRGGKLKISGAQERIEYLASKRASARVGGLKSAESRRKNSSVSSSGAQASRNPPDPVPVPDLPPDPVPDSPPDREIRIAPSAPREKSPGMLELEAKVDAVAGTKRGRPSKNSVPMPPDWKPRGQETATAIELGVDCFYQSEKFRDWHSAKGSKFVDWDAAFRTWLRNAVEFGRGRGSSTGKTPLEQQIERVRMLEEQERAESERAT